MKELLDSLIGVDPDYTELYRERVGFGRVESARRRLAVVSICRTAMPYLVTTMKLVEQLAASWGKCEWYVYENDSADDTAQVLDGFAAKRPWMTVEHETLGVTDERGFQHERTVRLAACRTRCQDWVRARSLKFDYVMVLDTDPHGGFVVEGVLNSLGWMLDLQSWQCRLREPGAIASHSLLAMHQGRRDGDDHFLIAAYDAWACRLNDWADRRRHEWFHALLPPIGSPPIPMNSAFGGLCLYRTEAFLAGVYKGGDCEHVHFHRTMQRAGWQLYLNPGSRYVAILP